MPTDHIDTRLPAEWASTSAPNADRLQELALATRRQFGLNGHWTLAD